MVAITPDGESDTWPVAEMHFNPQCWCSIISSHRRAFPLMSCAPRNGRFRCQGYGRDWHYGVEMFWSDEGELLLNEMARGPTTAGTTRWMPARPRSSSNKCAIVGLPLGPRRSTAKPRWSIYWAQGFEGTSLKAPTSLTTTRMCTSICTENTTVGSCERWGT